MERRPVVVTLIGRVPSWALAGDGSGSGSGSGYGDGSGSGYGSGYGSGDGSGSGYGYGYGYGYGDGSGSGSGDGSGDGYGSGSGSGSGYGYGYGSGYGDGSGSGDGDIERARPSVVHVTARQIQRSEACSDAVANFKATFPNGADFPNDIPRAIAVGLNVAWVQQHLGLILPLTEDIPESSAA